MQDQWNQFATYEVSSQIYGRPISTVFADPQCYLYDEDNDPAISSLRYFDYRYLRFFYHPLQDKFCLLNGWKDPGWENVKVMRGGLDADDRDSREQIFGSNIVDIKQKSVPQLLIDEVSGFLSIGVLGQFSLFKKRPSIHSTCSRSPVLSSGLWTNITTMLFVYSLYHFSA